MKVFTKAGIFVICIFAILTLSSCKDTTRLKFDPMANFGGGDTVALDMDLKDVVTKGIVIPSKRQCNGGKFVFEFDGQEGKYYKIFYQNESYKFAENNELSCENFYGSWEDTDVEFKRINATGKVRDSLRIVGNPRNESRYFGSDVDDNPFSSDKIQNVVRRIEGDTLWSRLVREQAVASNFTYERMLQLNAIYVLKEGIHQGSCNQRWKRNPRVGCYSFMLVVCDENSLDLIPDYIKNIGKTNENGDFVNPYYYFKHNKIKGVDVVLGNKTLKTRAVITSKYGLYLDDILSGGSQNLYSKALFEQFFNVPSKQYNLRNIPVIQDVVSDDNPYTQTQYEANKTRFDSTQLLYDWPVVSSEPGKTVRIDTSDNSLVLVNPGNDDINNLKKESTGIRTRVGFTYGKFRGKIKFPVMLNDDNMWNGLTYAFWLIFQDEHKWNDRRTSESGYIDKADDSPNPERKTDYFYSEIDIEILKATPEWPDSKFRKAVNDSVTQRARRNNDVAYCCTNWDLACRDPKNFKDKITEISYKGKKYEANRWTELYKALTIKTSVSNDVFKEDYYFYEIEWRPTEIIWRIGPSPDKMEVVGYMNDEYTNIPNNQMLCIVTQEYHYSEWWPPVVFWQGLIPYNKTDITGKVFEIVIE